MSNSADILNGKILIVDDQQANIQMLEQLLRGAGYSGAGKNVHRISGRTVFSAIDGSRHG